MGGLARVRGLGAGLARRLAGQPDDAYEAAPRGPALSVIVPIYAVEAYLPECLDSILAQGFEDIEVLLVDDGSPDGSGQIAAAYAERDTRFRLVARPNGGLGAARNTGIREASGRYLTFVDSDDVLPLDALATLMDAALESGSDIVVGAVDRFDSTREWQPPWVARVHATRHTAITIDRHLPLLRNLYTWNKVFRRDFWDAQGLWFREGVAYEDQPIITQLFARAAAIDVLPDVVYRYRSRDDKSSISQQTATVADLRARILAWEVSRDTFRHELSSELYDAWLGTLFDTHFHWYLSSDGTTDDTYWEVLRSAIQDLTGDASPAIWDRTEPHKRVLIELARQDRRDDVRALVAQHPGNLRRWPSAPRDDGVLIHLPFLGDPELADELFLLRPEQLELVHLAEGFAWGERDGVVVGRLSGWAYVAKVDLSTHDAVTRVLLRNERTGAEVGAKASRRTDPVFLPPVDDPWCDYAPGAFDVELPLVGTLTGGAADDVWSLAVEVSIGGLTVAESMTRIHRSGTAAHVRALRLPDGSRIVADSAPGSALAFRIARRGVEVRDVRVIDRALTGRLVGEGQASVTSVEVSLGPQHASTVPDGTGAFRVDLPADASPTPGQPRRWRVRVQRREGGPWGLVPAEDLPDVVGRLGPETNRNGELVVVEWAVGAEAEEVRVREDGTLLVRGRVHGDGTALVLAAAGPRVTPTGPECEVTDGRFEAVLRLRSEVYRFGELPLPTGEYDVVARVRAADGQVTEVPLRSTPGLATALPLALQTAVHEGRVQRGSGGRVRIVLLRPLGGARGRFQQHRLRTASQTAPLERCLLVRSAAGERATGHGASVQSELRRRGADLPVYWAVLDHGVPVPDGGIAVIWNSAEWFDVLGRAKYYLDDRPQPGHYRKPEGQVLVQVLPSHPAADVPGDDSDGSDDSDDGRAAAWDYLVSPSHAATALLGGLSGFRGEVLEVGSPGNDVLLSADADGIRRATRAVLGVRDDQVLVLHAPADRGDRSTLPPLDLALLRRSLPDEVVVMVRGRLPADGAARGPGLPAGCLDVTDHPDVSDLVLAADAAVLDDGPLRFDVAVTGKPMVFHVPGAARLPMGFAATAPGPLAGTTEEVVRWLGDLDGLRREFAAAYSTFRAEHLELEDGHAGQRLVEAVFSPRGDA